MTALPFRMSWLWLAFCLAGMGCTPPPDEQPAVGTPSETSTQNTDPVQPPPATSEPAAAPGAQPEPLATPQPPPPPPEPVSEPVAEPAPPGTSEVVVVPDAPEPAAEPAADSTSGPRTAPGMVAEPEPSRDVEFVEDPFVIFEETAPGETFPGVALDVANKQVRVRGYIALQRGGLEYLACTPRGKTHESLVALQCQPEHLNLALIALGLEPRPQVSEQGEAIALEGDRVVVELLWTEAGEEHCVRVEDLIYDYARDDAMQRVGWVYTGGRLVDDPRAMWEEDEEKRKEYGKVYSANLLGNLGAIFHDPDALLDTPLIEGGNDEAFYAYYERLPPRFTKTIFQVRLATDGELLPLPPPEALPADSTGTAGND